MDRIILGEMMTKEDVIETTGKVISALPNAHFKVELENGVEIVCHISGKIRKHFINILPGDLVDVIISPYDMSKGRIVYRTKGGK